MPKSRHPFALSLSKRRPSFQSSEKEEQGFDKLSPNGKEREAGFTLVELMVVIVILGLLTTLVVINVLPSQDTAMRKKAEADIATIEQALEMYRLEKMAYPPSLAALTGEGGRGYIKRLPDDPWGRAYLYANPGQHGAFDLSSQGADGAPGGEDENADITNWK